MDSSVHRRAELFSVNRRAHVNAERKAHGAGKYKGREEQ